MKNKEQKYVRKNILLKIYSTHLTENIFFIKTNKNSFLLFIFTENKYYKEKNLHLC